MQGRSLICGASQGGNRMVGGTRGVKTARECTPVDLKPAVEQRSNQLSPGWLRPVLQAARDETIPHSNSACLGPIPVEFRSYCF